MFDRRLGEMGEDMHADDERDGWLESMVDYVDELEKNLLVDVNDSSIFYGDFITPSPDFPCMSSSSFSSLTPSPVEGSSMTCSSTSSSSSSSSSAASWAVLKSDAVEDDHVDKKRSVLLQPQAAADVMETFGYMDLMENSDIWDDPIPSSIFEDFQLQSLSSPSASSSPQQIPEQQKHTMMLQGSNSSSTDQDQEGGGGGGVQEGTSEDLAMFFLEWLKSNKESISAEDLRKIRLKRSTIESAARRLGGGKEGMKLLLKLILQWVQNHHLHQGKRMREPKASLFHSNYQFHNIPNPPSHWNIPHPPPPSPSSYVTDPAETAGTAAVSDIPSIVGYMGDPLISGNPVLESAPAWPPSPFALHSNFNPFLGNNIHHPPPQDFAGVNENQYTYGHFPGNGEKLVRLASSATKEARQKRKASQKRFLSHHSEHQNQQQHNQIAADQHARLIGSDNNFNSAAAAAQANPANWVYWPSAAVHFSSSPPVLQPAAPVQSQPSDRPVVQSQNYQRQERRQVGSSPVGPS